MALNWKLPRGAIDWKVEWSKREQTPQIDNIPINEVNKKYVGSMLTGEASTKEDI